MSLQTAARLGETTYESPTKHAFVGRVHVAEEGSFSDDFSPEQLLLRVRPDCPVSAGDEMIDGVGRRLLLLEHDRNPIYRSHRLVPLTHELAWSRTGTITDPATKAKREGAVVPLGEIWVALQIIREIRDGVVNIKQDLRRVITRAPLQLKDKVGAFTVERVAQQLGVSIAEVM